MQRGCSRLSLRDDEGTTWQGVSPRVGSRMENEARRRVVKASTVEEREERRRVVRDVP